MREVDEPESSMLTLCKFELPLPYGNRGGDTASLERVAFLLLPACCLICGGGDFGLNPGWFSVACRPKLTALPNARRWECSKYANLRRKRLCSHSLLKSLARSVVWKCHCKRKSLFDNSRSIVLYSFLYMTIDISVTRRTLCVCSYVPCDTRTACTSSTLASLDPSRAQTAHNRLPAVVSRRTHNPDVNSKDEE